MGKDDGYIGDYLPPEIKAIIGGQLYIVGDADTSMTYTDLSEFVSSYDSNTVPVEANFVANTLNMGGSGLSHQWRYSANGGNSWTIFGSGADAYKSFNLPGTYGIRLSVYSNRGGGFLGATTKQIVMVEQPQTPVNEEPVSTAQNDPYSREDVIGTDAVDLGWKIVTFTFDWDYQGGIATLSNYSRSLKPDTDVFELVFDGNDLTSTATWSVLVSTDASSMAPGDDQTVDCSTGAARFTINDNKGSPIVDTSPVWKDTYRRAPYSGRIIYSENTVINVSLWLKTFNGAGHYVLYGTGSDFDFGIGDNAIWLKNGPNVPLHINATVPGEVILTSVANNMMSGSYAFTGYIDGSLRWPNTVEVSGSFECVPYSN